jgi:hypothetical protein
MGTSYLAGNTERDRGFRPAGSKGTPKEGSMDKARITVSLNGSLKVEGNVRLVDHEGVEIPTKEGIPFFLCRCGESGNKPFCDGSHKRIGFQAD